MAKKHHAHGKITVRKIGGSPNTDISLTFGDEGVFAETLRKLRRSPEHGVKYEVISHFWGYQTFQSVDEAIRTVDIWTM